MTPFTQQMEQECVIGSAIALEQYETAITIVPDLVLLELCSKVVYETKEKKRRILLKDKS
jgi:hypothetical protein